MSILRNRLGGINIVLGTYTLTLIKSYAPKWTHIFDESNSFQNWDFSESKTYKGKRFSATVQTAAMPEAEYKKLLSVLQSRIFNFKSEDYEGTVEIVEVPATLESANGQGNFYSVNFSVTATTIDSSSGSL